MSQMYTLEEIYDFSNDVIDVILDKYSLDSRNFLSDRLEATIIYMNDGKLNVNDSKIVKDPLFQYLYITPDEELISKALDKGLDINNKSRLDLIRNIIILPELPPSLNGNLTFIDLPPEIVSMIGENLEKPEDLITYSSITPTTRGLIAGEQGKNIGLMKIINKAKAYGISGGLLTTDNIDDYIKKSIDRNDKDVYDLLYEQYGDLIQKSVYNKIHGYNSVLGNLPDANNNPFLADLEYMDINEIIETYEDDVEDIVEDLYDPQNYNIITDEEVNENFEEYMTKAIERNDYIVVKWLIDNYKNLYPKDYIKDYQKEASLYKYPELEAYFKITIDNY